MTGKRIVLHIEEIDAAEYLEGDGGPPRAVNVHDADGGRSWWGRVLDDAPDRQTLLEQTIARNGALGANMREARDAERGANRRADAAEAELREWKDAIAVMLMSHRRPPKRLSLDQLRGLQLRDPDEVRELEQECERLRAALRREWKFWLRANKRAEGDFPFESWAGIDSALAGASAVADDDEQSDARVLEQWLMDAMAEASRVDDECAVAREYARRLRSAPQEPAPRDEMPAGWSVRGGVLEGPRGFAMAPAWGLLQIVNDDNIGVPIEVMRAYVAMPCSDDGHRTPMAPPSAPQEPAPPRDESVHHLKTWPQFFAAVIDGRKTFELRKNDRGFAVGDTLVLQEYEPGPDRYTGREVTRRISYVTDAAAFGMRGGHVCLGFAAPAPDDRAAFRALAERWKSEDDTGRWGTHEKSACARELLALCTEARSEPTQAEPCPKRIAHGAHGCTLSAGHTGDCDPDIGEDQPQPASRCPACGKDHHDEGEWATRLHLTHRCVNDYAGEGCGHEWRDQPQPRTSACGTCMDAHRYRRDMGIALDEVAPTSCKHQPQPACPPKHHLRRFETVEEHAARTAERPTRAHEHDCALDEYHEGSCRNACTRCAGVKVEGDGMPCRRCRGLERSRAWNVDLLEQRAKEARCSPR